MNAGDIAIRILVVGGAIDLVLALLFSQRRDRFLPMLVLGTLAIVIGLLLLANSTGFVDFPHSDTPAT